MVRGNIPKYRKTAIYIPLDGKCALHQEVPRRNPDQSAVYMQCIGVYTACTLQAKQCSCSVHCPCSIDASSVLMEILPVYSNVCTRTNQCVNTGYTAFDHEVHLIHLQASLGTSTRFPYVGVYYPDWLEVHFRSIGLL